MPLVKNATKPWKAKMKDVIRKEARMNKLIKYRFTEDEYGKCESPGHCAVGALIVAAGVSDQDIVEFSKSGGSFKVGKIGQLLFDTYRVDDMDLWEIISSNDNNAVPQLSSVINRIDALPSRLRVRPPEKWER